MITSSNSSNVPYPPEKNKDKRTKRGNTQIIFRQTKNYCVVADHYMFSERVREREGWVAGGERSDLVRQ